MLEFEELFEKEVFHSPGYWMLGDAHERYHQAQQFIEGSVTYPTYSYPRLMKYKADNYKKYHEDCKRVDTLQLLMDSMQDSLQTEPAIRDLYLEKIQFISNEISLLHKTTNLLGTRASAENKHLYAQANEKLYGAFDKKLFLEVLRDKSVFDTTYAKTIELCRKYSLSRFTVLSDLVDTYDSGRLLDANTIVQISNEYLKQQGLSDYGWSTVISDTSTAVSVSYVEKKFILPSKIRRSNRRVKQLLVHEIETHIRRFENAKMQDHLILKKGTLKGTFIEEGVGIFSEVLVDTGNLSENSGFKRAVHRYVGIGLALGLDGKTRASIKEVFDDLLIYKYGSVQVSERRLKDTYSVIENIYRGSDFSDPKVIFWRAKIYLEGFMKVLNYYHEKDVGHDLLNEMYSARYDVVSPTERSLVLDVTQGLHQENIE